MSTCAAARFLRAAGPVAMPFRACCTAALITAGAREIQCTAGDGVTEPEPVVARLGAPAPVDVPVGAPGAAAAGSVPVAAAAGSHLVAAVAGRRDHGAGWPCP
jgi:hypothetical protein